VVKLDTESKRLLETVRSVESNNSQLSADIQKLTTDLSEGLAKAAHLRKQIEFIEGNFDRIFRDEVDDMEALEDGMNVDE
jgi:hypothetical protein